MTWLRAFAVTLALPGAALAAGVLPGVIDYYILAKQRLLAGPQFGKVCPALRSPDSATHRSSLTGSLRQPQGPASRRQQAQCSPQRMVPRHTDPSISVSPLSILLARTLCRMISSWAPSLQQVASAQCTRASSSRLVARPSQSSSKRYAPHSCPFAAPR